MRRDRAPALLPPPLPRWPATLRAGDLSQPPQTAPEIAAAALARIRAEALWWPAPRRGAARPRALALGAAARAAARAALPDAEILFLADPARLDPARLDPERIEAVFAPPDAPALAWAALGGLDAPGAPEPLALLSRARGRSPWTGEPVDLAAAVDAQATLLSAARAVGGRAGLVGMSPWKRRCLRPFLVGPDGPPLRARDVAEARSRGLTPVIWGAAAARATSAGEAAPLRVEDGFLRSVGLGLRHVPPLSLVIDRAPPHFDATRPNGFEALVAAAEFPPALLRRAERLAGEIVALGLSKYNLGGAGAPPDPGGRMALLVAGQVESDASIRLGARDVRTNLDLLRAARARFPEAFLVWRPHPDVLTGLRPGAVPADAVRALADAEAPGATVEACLAWADRVASMTSLIGFEALMRGKAATVFGRPFYAGWGLSDDVDPPSRPRSLTLAELLAAALILYPRYVDPVSGLPAPPEIAVAALARERALAGRPSFRLRRLWRDAISRALNLI